MMDTSKVQQVLIDRKILISLLEGMTEPAVRIAVTDNHPLFIASQVGDRPAAAWIAPIIREEEE